MPALREENEHPRIEASRVSTEVEALGYHPQSGTPEGDVTGVVGSGPGTVYTGGGGGAGGGATVGVGCTVAGGRGVGGPVPPWHRSSGKLHVAGVGGIGGLQPSGPVGQPGGTVGGVVGGVVGGGVVGGGVVGGTVHVGGGVVGGVPGGLMLGVLPGFAGVVEMRLKKGCTGWNPQSSFSTTTRPPPQSNSNVRKVGRSGLTWYNVGITCGDVPRRIPKVLYSFDRVRKTGLH